MKIRLKLILIGFTNLLLFTQPLAAVAATFHTEVTVNQVTSLSSREDGPVIHQDEILWTDSRGSSFDIYGKNLKTSTEFPVLVKEGDQFLAGYNGRYVVYSQLLPSDPNSYNVWLYNVKNRKDIEIAGGLGDQLATDFNDGKIAYIDGYGTGDLYIYDINKKSKTFIDHNASDARISGDRVVWYSNNDIKVYDLDGEEFINIPNPDNAARSVPDIYKDQVVYYYEKNGLASIHLYDIHNDEEKTLTETSTYTLNRPSIWGNYVVWSKETGPHTGGVEGTDLRSGEIFEVYPQGPQQNAVMPPTIRKNTVAWMSWRTGNGDIYSASLKRTKSSP